MNPENLFEYESWANGEIAQCLSALDDPPEKALLLMSHIVGANILWLCRMQNKTSDIAVWKAYSKTEIVSEVKRSSSDLLNYVKNISGSDLEEVVSYKNTKGESFKSTIKDILTHLTIH